MNANTKEMTAVEVLVDIMLDAQQEYDTNVTRITLNWEDILNQGVSIYAQEMADSGKYKAFEEALKAASAAYNASEAKEEKDLVYTMVKNRERFFGGNGSQGQWL